MIEIWTDGSSLGNPGPGGWAWKCPETDIIGYGECPGSFTNNEMELEAIMQAIGACKDRSELKIHSDSKLAVYIVAGIWKAKDQRMFDRKRAIRMLIEAKKLKIGFHLVKGHADDATNKQVDALAKQAARRAQMRRTR